MGLSSDEVRTVLSKVTNLAEGLFQETASRVKHGMTISTFVCDSESEEYTVLVNAKDKVVEIKSEFSQFTAEHIDRVLNPPPPPAPPVPGSTFQGITGQIGQQTGFNPPDPQSFNKLLSVPVSNVLNIAPMIQYVVDFIAANPGCLSSQMDPANNTPINEAAYQQASAWRFDNIDSDEENTISFESTCGMYTAYVVFDSTTNTTTSVYVVCIC